MRLVEDLGNNTAHYLIITGDGRTELKVLRALSVKFNGKDLILFFPFPPRQKKKGLNALNAIKIYSNIGINSIIFIVDGDILEGEPANIKIQEYLKSIGIQIESIIPIQDALLLSCKSGNREIKLFCIISGPQTFIEEEIAELIKLTLRIGIDLSGDRDSNWKGRVKRDIKRILRENNTNIEKLISKTGIRKLETSFPNISAAFKKIEEDFIRKNS